MGKRLQFHLIMVPLLAGSLSRATCSPGSPATRLRAPRPFLLIHGNEMERQRGRDDETRGARSSTLMLFQHSTVLRGAISAFSPAEPGQAKPNECVAGEKGFLSVKYVALGGRPLSSD